MRVDRIGYLGWLRTPARARSGRAPFWIFVAVTATGTLAMHILVPALPAANCCTARPLTSSGGGRPCSSPLVFMSWQVRSPAGRQVSGPCDRACRAGGGRVRWIGAGPRDRARQRRRRSGRLAHGLANYGAEPRTRYWPGGRRVSRRLVRLALDLCRVGGARHRHVGRRVVGITGDGRVARRRGLGPHARQLSCPAAFPLFSRLHVRRRLRQHQLLRVPDGLAVHFTEMLHRPRPKSGFTI
jgi:hypothetical protein